MRKLMNGSLAFVFLLFVGSQRLSAQAELNPSIRPEYRTMSTQDAFDLGGVMDYIFKLSGPSFEGWVFAVSCPLRGTCGFGLPLNSPAPLFRVRLSLGRLTDEYIATDSTSSHLVMEMTHIALEWTRLQPIGIPVEIGLGPAVHRFKGDANTFTNYSAVGYVQARPSFGVLSAKLRRLNLRAGYGAHYFGPFESTDFAPVNVTMERDKSELVPFWYLGLELHLGR